MNPIIQDTLQKIKSKNITPVARWKYVVKKYSFWCAFLAIVLLGGVSFSVAFHTLSQLDWDLYRFVHQNPFTYSLSLLPYFWLILISLFLGLAFFDLRKTENGYRFSWLRMSLISIGGIAVLGLIFSLTSLAGNFNSLLAKNVPYYGQHMMTKELQWTQPQAGFLSGTLTNISENNLEISDLNNKNWNVLLDEKTIIRPAAVIETGAMIKIIGIEKSDHTFQASEIRPWMGQGMMNSASENPNARQMKTNGHGMMNR